MSEDYEDDYEDLLDYYGEDFEGDGNPSSNQPEAVEPNEVIPGGQLDHEDAASKQSAPEMGSAELPSKPVPLTVPPRFSSLGFNDLRRESSNLTQVVALYEQNNADDVIANALNPMMRTVSEMPEGVGDDRLSAPGSRLLPTAEVLLEYDEDDFESAPETPAAPSNKEADRVLASKSEKHDLNTLSDITPNAAEASTSLHDLPAINSAAVEEEAAVAKEPSGGEDLYDLSFSDQGSGNQSSEAKNQETNDKPLASVVAGSDIGAAAPVVPPEDGDGDEDPYGDDFDGGDEEEDDDARALAAIQAASIFQKKSPPTDGEDPEYPETDEHHEMASPTRKVVSKGQLEFNHQDSYVGAKLHTLIDESNNSQPDDGSEQELKTGAGVSNTQIVVAPAPAIKSAANSQVDELYGNDSFESVHGPLSMSKSQEEAQIIVESVEEKVYGVYGNESFESAPPTPAISEERKQTTVLVAREPDDGVPSQTAQESIRDHKILADENNEIVDPVTAVSAELIQAQPDHSSINDDKVTAHNESKASTDNDAYGSDFENPLATSTVKIDDSDATSHVISKTDKSRPAVGNTGTGKINAKDRAFLDSLQYNAGDSDKPKKSASMAALDRNRPVSGLITKRDMLRHSRQSKLQSQSLDDRDKRIEHPNGGRPASHRVAPRPESAKPKLENPLERTTALPKKIIDSLRLPSQSLSKDIAKKLFASTIETDAKCSKFCRHGRHFSLCKELLCVDTHEQFQWLNLIRRKASQALELVIETDELWRKKLDESLKTAVKARRVEQREELRQVNERMLAEMKQNQDLIRKGLRFYEVAREAIFQGKLTAVELYKATGWTVEHYEYFKSKLKNERDGAETRRRNIIDQKRAYYQSELITLRQSLKNPSQYLDRMLEKRAEAIANAVHRADHTLQHSIRMASTGLAKGETMLGGDKSAKDDVYDKEVHAERLRRSSAYNFDIVKSCLSAIADVCAEVKQLNSGLSNPILQTKASTGSEQQRDRSKSPVRKKAEGPLKKKSRPQIAPIKGHEHQTAKSMKRKGKKRATSARKPYNSGATNQILNKNSDYNGSEFETSDEEIKHPSAKLNIDADGDQSIEEVSHALASIMSEIAEEQGSHVSDIADEDGEIVVGRNGVPMVRHKSAATLEVTDGDDAPDDIEVKANERKDKRRGTEDTIGTAVSSIPGPRKNRAESEIESAIDEINSIADEIVSNPPQQEQQQYSEYEDDFAEGSSSLLRKDVSKDHEVSKQKPASLRRTIMEQIRSDPMTEITKVKDNMINKRICLKDILRREGTKKKKKTKETKSLKAVRQSVTSKGLYDTDFEPVGSKEEGSSIAMDSGLQPDWYSCHECHKRFCGVPKHLPSTLRRDEIVFERAKLTQKQTGHLYPRYYDLNATLGSDQNSLVKQIVKVPQMSSKKRSTMGVDKFMPFMSQPMHKADFCTWACAKRWALRNVSIQRKYETGMLIDLAAGCIVDS